MELKPHQVAAHDAIFSRLSEGVDSQLCALPTGTGKTFLACEVSRSFQRTLFCCHREELVRQTAETMNRVYPALPIGFIAPGLHEIDAPFVVAMIQTLHRRKEKIPQDHFDLVVIDEAHHGMARTWRETAEHFTPRLRLGLSATPERLDGSDLSNLFSEISYEMTVAQAINQNYLVPVLARQCLTSCSLAKVRTTAGDFNEKDLSAAIDCQERNRFIVEKYREHAPGRKAVAFCVSIAHAQHIAEAFQEAGITADWLAGNSPDRQEKLQRFASGEIRVLASCQVLTEGFDDKTVDCVLLCRPTKSRSLFAQMIGRGLRLAEGKQDCLVLDFIDVSGKHSLATAWRFLGYPRQPKDNEPLSSAEGEKKARESRVIAVDLEREINLLLPPPEIPITFGSHQWHYEPATEKQIAYLDSLGYDVVNGDYSKGQAAAIIGNHPAASWQLEKLAKLGYDISVPWTRAQFFKALEKSKDAMQSALLKIRRAGFQIEAHGRKVQITPKERLTLDQRAWLKKNKSGLLKALRD